jgi:hypothetical protein
MDDKAENHGIPPGFLSVTYSRVFCWSASTIYQAVQILIMAKG